MRVLSVVGARPNFVKIAPILRSIESANRAMPSGTLIQSVLVHTEQHYDDAMSSAFFTDLQIPSPDWTLGVGSGSHAVQTAEVLRRFEPVLLEVKPDVVVVVGDVNSTAACALAAAKLGIRVAHVEAGLRSFDRSMPEEINRVVTDAIANLLFTTEESANEHLRREGHLEENIFFVGNVMIDSLLHCRRLAERSRILERLSLTSGGVPSPFALVTLHRPSNVDDPRQLATILGALREVARELPVLFPAHPRTRACILRFGLTECVVPLRLEEGHGRPVPQRISLLEPLGYVDFLRLMSAARLVLTDSGGIQEETTCLGVPCVTLRENTERPVTIAMGTNHLAGTDPFQIVTCARSALANGSARGGLPPLWDGRAADRIVRVLLSRVSGEGMRRR